MNYINTLYNTPAFEEFIGIFGGWRIWLTLAWNDIKLRYRRSSLGPFWITLSMAIKIYFMGFLYSHLFKIDITTYFPFLASGIIVWTTVSTIINESAFAFVLSENYLRNIKILFSHIIMRIILRNLIIFAHNILAFIPIIMYFHGYDNNFSALNIMLLIPNLLLISIMAFSWVGIAAIIGTRFRDMALIIDSLIQIVFFVTPIMWMPSLLPEKYQFLAWLNPFYHVVNLIKEPLLGHSVDIISYQVIFGLITVGFTAFYYLMNKNKYKVIFWL